MPTQIYQAVVEIAVEREIGPVSITLDKLKDHLTGFVRLDLDYEDINPPDDQHRVVGISIDWETLTPRSLTHSTWSCPECGETAEVEIRELEAIGTPMCGNCDREMVECDG